MRYSELWAAGLRWYRGGRLRLIREIRVIRGNTSIGRN